MSVTSNTLSRRQAGRGYSCLRKELHSAYRPDRIILPGEGTILARSAHCRCSVRAEDPQTLTVILCVKRGLGGESPNSRATRAELPLSKNKNLSNFHFRHSRKCVGSGTASRRGVEGRFPHCVGEMSRSDKRGRAAYGCGAPSRGDRGTQPAERPRRIPRGQGRRGGLPVYLMTRGSI